MPRPASIRSLFSVALGLGLAAAVPVPGCNNEPGTPEGDASKKRAESQCDLLFRCGCLEPGYADEPTCVQEKRDQFNADRDMAKVGELRYDGECVEQALIDDDTVDCTTIVEQQIFRELPRSCRVPCFAYHGAKDSGEECRSWGPYSDCAQGLVCRAGTCTDLCDFFTVPEGGACMQDTVLLGLCDNLTFCGMSGTCEARGFVDEDCSDRLCVAGLTCRGTCQLAATPGEACGDDLDCESLICENDVCVDEAANCDYRAVPLMGS